MALAKSALAEVQRSLATAAIGGLISTTLLTLCVLPLLYLRVSKPMLFFYAKKVTSLRPNKQVFPYTFRKNF